MLRLRSALNLAGLTLAVHIDAFGSAPLPYLQAVLWRMRGLRLRSRNRLAALAGRSPRAYALWIARQAASSPTQVATERVSALCDIQLVIDARGDEEAVRDTLKAVDRLDHEQDPIVIRSTADLDVLRAQSGSSPLWLLPLASGDSLDDHAVEIYAAAASANPDAVILYADDDLLGADGRRTHPHFKPDWNPELFEHHDYLTGSCLLRVDAEMLEGLSGSDWVAALVRRALARGHPPIHVRALLHHRRSRAQPKVPTKPQTLSRNAPSTKRVTVIIPTRDRVELLRPCMDGVLRTDWQSLDVIIVDNESSDPETLEYLERIQGPKVSVLRVPGPFNYSALNNEAVRHAAGELLCFLNNDVEIIDPDWLALLVDRALQDDIGAVGARLLYPDGTIQHAGVFTGIGGGAAHAHRFQPANDPGYFHRASLPQRVSAVTGACLVVEQRKFMAVGGFDEENFPVAFNDVDLCLKLNGRGWQAFYEPRATLIHHESKSRGSDRLRINRARFAGELSALKRIWGTDTFCDPYHHPNLSPFCEQFLIAV